MSRLISIVSKPIKVVFIVVVAFDGGVGVGLVLLFLLLLIPKLYH